MDEDPQLARTTIANREVYLRYLSCFLAGHGIESSESVSLEELLKYQHKLYAHEETASACL